MSDEMDPAAPPNAQATDALLAALTLTDFPRSAFYDPVWMLQNLMGPNAVWLAEALSQVMKLERGMRVLDMGCGRAISSILLAKEFDLQVWATDLWIAASENWQRICAAGLQDQVFPIHAEAHALPFADGFFDALVSLDAYHYFGTDDLYLAHFSQLVKAGGRIGIVVPGLTHEFTSGLTPHLGPFWHPEFWSFHSPEWWRTHWERSETVEVEVADTVPRGWEHWLRWLEVAGEHGFRSSEQEMEMLRVDAGRNLSFTRIVARRL